MLFRLLPLFHGRRLKKPPRWLTAIGAAFFVICTLVFVLIWPNLWWRCLVVRWAAVTDPRSVTKNAEPPLRIKDVMVYRHGSAYLISLKFDGLAYQYALVAVKDDDRLYWTGTSPLIGERMEGERWQDTIMDNEVLLTPLFGVARHEPLHKYPMQGKLEDIKPWQGHV